MKKPIRFIMNLLKEANRHNRNRKIMRFSNLIKFIADTIKIF